MAWGKRCEEKHREGKEMKRSIYLEMRLWEGTWLRGQSRESLHRTWKGILQRMALAIYQWVQENVYSLSKKRNTFY